jgi:hypothetical protein
MILSRLAEHVGPQNGFAVARRPLSLAGIGELQLGGDATAERLN